MIQTNASYQESPWSSPFPAMPVKKNNTNNGNFPNIQGAISAKTLVYQWRELSLQGILQGMMKRPDAVCDAQRLTSFWGRKDPHSTVGSMDSSHTTDTRGMINRMFAYFFWGRRNGGWFPSTNNIPGTSPAPFCLPPGLPMRSAQPTSWGGGSRLVIFLVQGNLRGVSSNPSKSEVVKSERWTA